MCIAIDANRRCLGSEGKKKDVVLELKGRNHGTRNVTPRAGSDLG